MVPILPQFDWKFFAALAGHRNLCNHSFFNQKTDGYVCFALVLDQYNYIRTEQCLDVVSRRLFERVVHDIAVKEFYFQEVVSTEQ